MSTPQVEFRPFLEFTGGLNTSLTPVSLTPEGDISRQNSLSTSLGWGISGTHSFRHAKVGLDYKGLLNHYTRDSFYDSTNQSLLLGVSDTISRHSTINLRVTAGTYSQSNGRLGLTSTVPFDPSSALVPDTDFFNNRTSFLLAQADYRIQKSARLSFDLGGDFFLVRRRSNALVGVTGQGARADVQYRLRRRTTVGAAYSFNRYDFTANRGDTYIHSETGTYAVQLTRSLELSAFAGVTRLESKAIVATAVDPIIAAIIGVTGGTQIVHTLRHIPTGSARLSKTFHKGVVYVAGGHTVTPGNGLFLTSAATSLMGGYSYTFPRRLGFSLYGIRTLSSTQFTADGKYMNSGAGISGSYNIGAGLHAVASYWVNQYGSSDFDKYNRVMHTVRVGIGFTPGNIPLRIW